VNQIPKRDDPIYKEIESFEDYELTQCVAYEMAIRSDINSTPNAEPHRPIHYKKTEPTLLEYKNGYKVMFEFNPRKGYTVETKISFKDANEKYKDGCAIDAEKIKDSKTIKAFKSIVNEKQKQINEFEEKYHNAKTDDERILLISEDKEHEYCTDFKVENKISENFKRKKLKIDILECSTISLEVDLSKPLDEIIAYITHIKNDLEKNKDIVKTPIELLGTELQKADDISKMCTVNKNGKELCFDGRKGITRTQKLADMFYIYDMVKNGYKELRIRTAISEYYESEYNKNTDISDTTFRKYRDIAKDYIDNERYKELITGVKS